MIPPEVITEGDPQMESCVEIASPSAQNLTIRVDIVDVFGKKLKGGREGGYGAFSPITSGRTKFSTTHPANQCMPLCMGS